ncbi:unnamed protein product [Lupinus luteus]|uniref:PB1 domain-containing protein n=1 Tax=Lupinus luteus TaxID=3873 RepID=A0AAV1WSW4_LUPLU
MDPPLIPLSLSTVTTTLHNHPDSIESSPNYHIVNNETWPDNHVHDPLPNVPNAKLRLMCSYAGHIMPRPHDKSLSYVGGETRIVAVDRHTSLKDLCLRLSHSLLHGRSFTLKYQLPNEELDNLITVTTDEDLDNMVEEHDRLASSKHSPSSRLRVFLFFNKPDTAVSMCSLMDDVKSETWFVDALNYCGILQRGVSDSAAVDQCLVNLDGVHETNDLEAQVIVDSTPTTVVDSTKEVKQELHSVENNSSYGSSSSASSMANLPPITVHGVGVNGCGRIQEQFAQMSFGTNGVRHNLLDDGYAISSAATPMNAIPEGVRNIVNTNNNNVNLVNVSDDDRSDHNGGLGVAASAVYKDGAPPIYPTKLATPTISEVGPNVYKATMASNPAFVHIPPNQFQQQYVTLPQNIHHQTHPIAIAPSATTNYGYDQYEAPTQDQLYYTQQPPQYQSMTPAAAAAALSDVSEQFPIDNTQYPNRDSQPV